MKKRQPNRTINFKIKEFHTKNEAYIENKYAKNVLLINRKYKFKIIKSHFTVIR